MHILFKGVVMEKNGCRAIPAIALMLFLGGCAAVPSQEINSVATRLTDVHGAGAQRSDPKTGDPADYPCGFGPQGDVRRIYNYVKIVRGESTTDRPYAIVDTGQTGTYNTIGAIDPPGPGDRFYGQDGSYTGLEPAYIDNGDGTVTDLNTGLMWQQDPGGKMTYTEAAAGASSFTLAGYDDWRLPTVKELYSLILFSGTDPSGETGPEEYIPGANQTGGGVRPFIDTGYFLFDYGDESTGERFIDAQFATSTLYTGTTMGGNRTMFGVNFADGRIKGYPSDATGGRQAKKFFVLYVRGNTEYGTNDFVDNRNGTVTDVATGLMWERGDSKEGMDWSEALEYVERLNAENYLGYSDWRLPDAKELHSIVDYSRSPQRTGSAAIDPVFRVSEITDEGDGTNYPFYWTGTTHLKSNGLADAAVYICFGEALGFMSPGGNRERAPGPSPRGGPPPRRK
jgi:hypothetical protein